MDFNLATIQNYAKRWGPKILAGALAGAVAALPMAGVMKGLNQLFAKENNRASHDNAQKEWGELPPKKITRKMADKTGQEQAVEPGKSWGPATWLAHLGYGAASASLFPVLTQPLPLPGLLRGIIFGLGLWAASYQGWVPALNFLPPASKETSQRNFTMILAHVVWGSLIGGLVTLLLKGE